MKRCAWFFMGILILTMIGFSGVGCSDKKPVMADSVLADSVADSIVADTLEAILEEQPMPKAADELFDDFFFNFAGNRKLQVKRILFPLAVVRNGKQEKPIEKKDWQMDHFFMRQEYYTLILDNRKQLDLVKDTSVSRVSVEKIYLRDKTVKQYFFDRKGGLWMLTAIHYKPISENQNASFLTFYDRFSSDSTFQIASMNDMVTFTAPDPDDDFKSITGEIVPEQWPMFKPAIIPAGVIYNILYGQKYTEGTQKILMVRGIANGLEMGMTFRRKGGAWKLVKFNS